MESLSFFDYVNLYHRWNASVVQAIGSYTKCLDAIGLNGRQDAEPLQVALSQLAANQLNLVVVGKVDKQYAHGLDGMLGPLYGDLTFSNLLDKAAVANLVIRYQPTNGVGAHLKLLPIETQASALTLSAWRLRRQCWSVVPLDFDNPMGSTAALSFLRATKEISSTERLALGIGDAQMAPKSSENDFLVPVWRYAELVLPAPQLRSEITLVFLSGKDAKPSDEGLVGELLAEGHSVVIGANSDHRLQASSRRYWQNLQANSGREPILYAAINFAKQTLDLRPFGQTPLIETEINSPQTQQAEVAAHIGPSDQSLGNKLAEAIVHCRLAAQKTKALVPLTPWLDQQFATVNTRLKQLGSQRHDLEGLVANSQSVLKQLVRSCEQTKKHRDHLAAKVSPSVKLLKKQTKILLELIASDKVERRIEELKSELVGSKSTRGLLQAMQTFKTDIYSNFIEFRHEVHLAHKLANSMIEKLASETSGEKNGVRPLLLAEFRQRLKKILIQSDRWRKRLSTTLTEHSVAVKRYFAETVKAIVRWYRDLRSACIHWYSGVMAPLTSHLKQQKQFLTQRLVDLSELQSSGAAVQGRLRGLRFLLAQFEAAQAAASELNCRLLPINFPSSQTQMRAPEDKFQYTILNDAQLI